MPKHHREPLRERAYDGSFPTLPPEPFPGELSRPKSSELEERESDWLLLIPIEKLAISDESPIDGSLEVGNVTFCSPERTKQELGDLIRDPESGYTQLAKRSAKLDEASAFVVLRQAGRLRSLRPTAHAAVRDAINILVAASCTWHGRMHPVATGPFGCSPSLGRYCAAFDLSVGGAVGNEQSIAPFQTLFIDKRWHQHLRDTGFIDVFDAIREGSICPQWRRQIRCAASMYGRSLSTVELPDALVFNVIAMETLLTRPSERNGRALARRIKGLLGWDFRRSYPEYEDHVKSLHQVRCAIVHDSDPRGVTGRLLLASDLFVENCLLNIARNLDHFPRKDAMIAVIDRFAKHESWPRAQPPHLRAFRASSFRKEEEEKLDEMLAHMRQ